MCGGCNISDKIKCKNIIANDLNQDLISLLKYAQQDNELKIAPDDCLFEHYKDVRSDKEHLKYSQEYRAIIGYMASYAGRYFDGGFARDRNGIRNIYKERLVNFKKQIPSLNEIKFSCKDYKDFDWDNISNAVVYIDPPYRNTKEYDKQSINYDEFYDFCRRIAKNNKVFISEYWMPDDFICIWQKERNVMQKSDRIKADKAVEKLYTL